MQTSSGNVALVLNAHFPYVRRAGRWPHGEESLHKVMAECYVPLLTMLHGLRSAGHALPLTLSISPILLEQLADTVIAKHFMVWLDQWRERAAADLAQFQADGDTHAAYLAQFYIDWIIAVEQNFVERFGRNLAAALRSFVRDPVEVLLAPATYAYLPQLSPTAAASQLEAGAMVVLRHLGRRPRGIWLPGGRPSAIQTVAGELGVHYMVGQPWFQSITTEMQGALPTIHPSQTLANHVIAPGVGYPADGLYREFYRDHPASGIAYWRVTGAAVPAEVKAWYDPYLAFNRVEEHAEHFVRALQEQMHTPNKGKQPQAVVVAFDAELFGHWWFEGVRWLQSVITRILAADDLQLVTLDQLHNAGLLESAAPKFEAQHPLFDHPLTRTLCERLQRAAAHFAGVVQRHPDAEGIDEALLRQAARELLLAQSSDWQALIATGAASEYAQRRFDEHVSRFERLLHYLERDEPSPDATFYLREIEELDNPFPFINYRMFS